CGSMARRGKSFLGNLRAAGAYGLAQFLMPIVGWLAGRTVVELIEAYDHWLAFALLAGVGGHMVWESFDDDDSKACSDITRGWLLFTMAIATSIDALAVGLSFAFLKINILLASTTIGVTAFSVTTAGFAIGARAGELLGKRARLAGGIVLIAIGLRILVSHLLDW
ncbi:MAG: manganese efflux pump MntP family protein, partial [Dehalococcoidia bacterium]|nr:manganese efflux pump MntP family protein [Dehalococcoidia bacterium]